MRNVKFLLPFFALACIDPDKIEKDVDEAVDKAVDKSIAGCERIFNEKLTTLLVALTEIVIPLRDEVNNQIDMTPIEVTTLLRINLGCVETMSGIWDCTNSTFFICPQNGE